MKKNLFKKISAMTLIIAMLLVLDVGCGGTKTSEKNTPSETKNENSVTKSEESKTNVEEKQEKVTLTFITWAEDSRIEAQKKLNDKFTAKYPNITIAIDKPAQYWEKLYTMVAGGTAPDIFFQQEMLPPTAAAEGLMEDLTPYIENDSSFKKGDIFEALYAPFTINGKLYVIPAVTYASILYYNKDMFDKAGIKYPDDSWTWDIYREAAKKMTVDSNKDGRIDQYGCTVNTLINFYLPWIFSNGGDLISSDRTKCLINSPENIETMQYLHDLIYVDKSSPIPSFVTGNVNQVGAFSFQTGKIAMEITGSWMIPTYETSKFNWGIAKIPKSPKMGKAVPMAYPNGYAMSPSGKHKEEAWKYISFASSEEGQMILAETGLGMPTNIKAANSDLFLKSSKVVDMKVVIDSMIIAKGPLTTPRWAEIGEGTTSIIQSIDQQLWLDKKPVKDALDEIAAKTDVILQEIAAGKSTKAN